jgi:hypothetical protein
MQPVAMLLPSAARCHDCAVGNIGGVWLPLLHAASKAPMVIAIVARK